jgi:hypothetical protein
MNSIRNYYNQVQVYLQQVKDDPVATAIFKEALIELAFLDHSATTDDKVKFTVIYRRFGAVIDRCEALIWAALQEGPEEPKEAEQTETETV